MNELDSDRVQTAVRPSSAEADKRRDQKFHLLPIGMSGDASVAQGNREIAGLGAFQNDACIGDRTVTLGAVQRIAERFRRGCNVVDQPGLPGLPVAGQPEAKQWIFQCFGRKLQKPNLARNADAHVFPIYLTDRQAGASQQRLEDNARLAQTPRGPTRRHA
jgi:hypothetical protein